MTAKTYHTSLEDAFLDGWFSAIELPVNGGEIHVHGLRCYVKSPRRIKFMRLSLERGRMAAEDLLEPLGMAHRGQVHWFVQELKFKLSTEKAPFKIEIIREGRRLFYQAIDNRKENEENESLTEATNCSPTER